MSFPLFLGGFGLENIKTNIKCLQDIISNLDDMIIAFSGGVDSTLLLMAAKKFAKSRVVAVTFLAPSYPEEEQKLAVQLAKQIGIQHFFLPTDELSDKNFINNTRQRCYYCKKHKFSKLIDWSKNNGYKWILEGTNADDIGEWRPGIKVLNEYNNVLSPLKDSNITKTEIRALARKWGIAVWNRPSSACLVSRLSYGTKITIEELKRVECAEKIVRSYFGDGVRVRSHGNLARIEVAANDIGLFMVASIRTAITEKLKELGYIYVTADLEGYRTGSMNYEMLRGEYE